MVSSCRRFYDDFYSLSFVLLLSLSIISLSSKSSQWILIGAKAQQPMGLTIHVHHTRTYHDGSRYDDMNNQVSDIDNDIPQSFIPNVTIQFESEMLQRIEQQSYDIFDVSYIEFVLHEYIQSRSSSVLSSSATRSHIFHKSTSSYRSKISVIDNEDTTTINNETVWFGSTITSTSESNNNSSDNNIMGFCSLYSFGGIIRSGTFTTDDATYDLIYLMTDQSYIMRSTLWADYPTDHFNHNQTYSFDNNNNNDAINEASRIQYPSMVTINPNEYEIVTDWIDVQGPAAIIYNNPSDDPSQSKSSSSNVVVDIIVIVTNRAMCEYARNNNNNSTPAKFPYCSVTVENYTPILNKIYQVIAETNNAMQYVNVEIRLKETNFLVDDGSKNNITGWDPIADNAGIDLVRKNAFVQQARNDQKADLVAIIAGGGGNCGIAVLFGFISITNHNCLFAYTFSHEIGHNFGGDHNRETYNNTNLTGYSYAYRDMVNRKYRTIVAYECDDQGGSRCPRIPYYSSSVITLPDGRILGDALNDNLRAIRANAPRLSSYRTTPTAKPSRSPSRAPSRSPSRNPSSRPSARPSLSPYRAPSHSPTSVPSYSPTSIPSYSPSSVPSYSPTISMSPTLSSRPSNQPSTSTNPSYRPSYKPTLIPSSLPSRDPSSLPITSPPIIVIIPPQPTDIDPKPPVSSPPVATCFSSINTVIVKDIGDIPLPELKIGDYVKTHYDVEAYTQVYGFGHYDHIREELFLRMTYDNNDDFAVDVNLKNSSNNHHDELSIEKHHYTNNFATTNPRYLEISQNHLIFVKRNGQQKIPIRALDVVVGDQISDGRQIITSIERIKRRGVYAPLTQSGDIIVSGVHVSNYVNLFDTIISNNHNNVNNDNNNNAFIIFNQHMIGHILFTPQRLFCRYCIETCKKEHYINGYGLLASMIVSSANIIRYMIGYRTNILIIIDYLIEMITSIQQFVWLLLIPIICTITIYAFSTKKQKIVYS